MSLFTSRAAIVCGMVGICLMSLSLFGGSWLHCKERTVLNNNQMTYVSFRIGLWKVCPINPPNNASENYVFRQSTDCIIVGYNYWNLDNFEHMEIWPNLQFVPQFVSRMRICAPFGCVGLMLLVIATFCTILGHFRLDNSMLLACGLFILAGILIGSGLLVFASILSDTYYEGLTADNETNITYNYGWAFFYAAAALAMAKLAVVFSVTSHMYKFGTVEEMVRAMVPGADRRLRQHISNERLVRAAPEVVPPPAPYRDPEPAIPDICETELQASPTAVAPQPAPQPPAAQASARFKTLSGREPRYAAPPRPPAQFYSLPRRTTEQPKQTTTFCTKSAV